MTRAIIAGELESRSIATDPMESVRRTINFSSLDWTSAKDTAWIYGIICGFDCEEDHEHDDICGGLDSMIEMAAVHRWTVQQVDRLRVLRSKWLEIQREADRHLSTAAELERLVTENAELKAENVALLTRLAFAEVGSHR